MASLEPVLSEAPGLRVNLVENGSGDGSADALRREIDARGWGAWVRLIALEQNLGFAGGNNRGMQSLADADSDARFVLLLNSDTVVRPGALAHCLGAMQHEPRIGVMSCLLLNSDGTHQNVTRRFPTPLRQVICSLQLPWLLPRFFGRANIYDAPPELMLVKRDCDWLGGAFMFIRREALEQVGPMDAEFFFYGEDIEFCHRFHRRGWRVHYDPAVAIVHRGGASSDPTRMPARMRSVLMWQARYRVQRQCYGRAAALLVRAADVLAFAARKLKMLCAGRRGDEDYRIVSDALSILLRPLRNPR